MPPAPRRTFNKTIDLEKLQALADALVKDEIPGDPQAQLVQDLMLLGTSIGRRTPESSRPGRRSVGRKIQPRGRSLEQPAR
jgi:hypothetical protein